MVSKPTVESSDPLEAIELYFENGWTDGLPVVPPTEDKVRAFLDYAGRDPGEVLLTVSETSSRCTVEAAAINAVMAGCRPEYFPVVLAALEGWADPRWGLGDRNYFYISLASTGGSAQLLIVNGPIRNELSLNSGINVFGPGYRANATIGRAMRLIIINVLGMVPGLFDMSVQGHPGKYSYCIAEDEEQSPWPPLHVEKGFAPGQSAVTVMGARAPVPVTDLRSTTPEGILSSVASVMRVAASHAGTIAVVLCAQHAIEIGKHGWSKEQVKRFLFERTRDEITEVQWKEAGGARSGTVLDSGLLFQEAEGRYYHGIMRSADDVMLVVAGGNNGGFSSVISGWSYWIPSGEYIIKPIRAR